MDDLLVILWGDSQAWKSVDLEAGLEEAFIL